MKHLTAAVASSWIGRNSWDGPFKVPDTDHPKANGTRDPNSFSMFLKASFWMHFKKKISLGTWNHGWLNTPTQSMAASTVEVPCLIWTISKVHSWTKTVTKVGEPVAMQQNHATSSSAYGAPSWTHLPYWSKYLLRIYFVYTYHITI